MRHVTLLFLTLLAAALFPAGSKAAEQMTVVSPNGHLMVVVECDGGNLYYRVARNGKILLKRSAISILKEARYDLVGSQQFTVDKAWQPVWGQFSTINDHFNQLSAQLIGRGLQLELLCRVYDKGIGLRFVFPQQPGLKGTVTEYSVEFRFDSDYPMYHPRGEVEPKGPIPISDFDPNDRGPVIRGLVNAGKDIPAALIPAVVDQGDLYLAILESDLYSAVSSADTTTMNLAPSATQPGLTSVNAAQIKGESYLTPWRVILLEEQIGELAVNTVPVNLASECKLENTSWIKTGKALWDWRVRGYEADNFTYGLDTPSIKRFIDFGSRNNIPYLLIDWHWYRVKEGKFVIVPEIDIQDAVLYGKEKSVELILYWDEWRGGALPMEEVYQLYSSFGAGGIKYGFRGNDAAFTAEAIRKAAEHGLTIDFHDLVCPMVGVHRTYPNALTREYAHAQMDAGHVSSPSAFLKMVMINMITGPLDMNHGFYALNTDPENTGRRGWNLTLDSTVAGENARALICFSGLIVLPDAPEEYQKKADLFEFIEKMPQANWDETRVLASRMAAHISVARRKGDSWFVGSAVNEEGGSLDLPLSFLDTAAVHSVTFYEDSANTHYVTNKESYQVRRGTVTSTDIVKVKMAPGGGHAMWIRPR